jgi:hypothetical protein
MPDLSVADKLVIAAWKLDEDNHASFTAEQLVVTAWQMYPETFGLRGFLDSSQMPTYPDSNRVFAEIMGTKPVRHRGWLEKVGNKTYRLTDAGRRRAEETTGRTSTRRAALDRRALEEVRRLLGARAIEKHRSGRSTDITFLDACALWGITPRSTAKEFSTRVTNFELLLDGVSTVIGDENFVLEHGGVSYTREDIDMLRDLSNELKARFRTEIGVIQQRKTER